MSTSHFGQAFGLVFRSDLPLPELAVLDGAGAQESSASVSIVLAAAVPERLEAPATCSGLFEASPRGFLLHVPGVAGYHATASIVTVAPEVGVDDDSVRAFLCGSVLGAVLHLRGMFVLHGSAVVTPQGGGAVFCGHATAGKSTLAAALAQRQHPVLADDLVAISFDSEGRPWCWPGLSRTKLWRDALEQLGMADRVRNTPRVRPSLDKYSLTMPISSLAVPLQHCYELRAHEQGSLVCAPIRGLSKLNVLQTHTFRPQFLAARGGQAAHMRRITALAPQIEMASIDRPRGEATLPAIVEWLEQDWRR